jgi:hypothetical protein
MQAVIAIVVTWVAIGVVVGIVMGRRGYHSPTWILVGAVFGPLTIPLTTHAVRDARRWSRPRTLFAGSVGTGTVDVLVGIDGSAGSEAALRNAVRLLGDRIGRLTLAGVVDYDSVGSTPPWDNETRALEDLERLRNAAHDVNPGTMVLVGQPATALMKEAVEGGYELLVIGRRGTEPRRR